MYYLARPATVHPAVVRLTVGFAMLVSLAMPAAASAADPVIAAAGDISCGSTTVQTDRCHQQATSDLLVNAGLSAVLTLGDAQYQNGGFSDFMNYYDKSWGRVKSITYPSVGNHEYQTSGATGYFDYFNGVGNATGRAGDRSNGYYSFDIGTWHLISLNSNDQCTIVSCSAGSPQETWLKADLAAHPNYCTLAYWHHPSFNSGNGGNLTAMQPLLTDLYNADADVILGGHAHHYERFAPQNPSGQLDNARGIRQFIVGTGGAFWTSIGSVKANSQVRQNTTYGVLKLTLHPTSYDWQFVPEAGGSFTDSGSGSCHGAAGPPPDTQKPTAPGNLTATSAAGQVSLSWQASTDNVGVTGYRVFRGTQQINSVSGTTTSYTDTGLAAGPYSYTVRAVDAATNVSDPSNTASATVPDTTKPTAPGNLRATGGSGQVALDWQLSTDDVGVTGYEIFRGTTQIGSVGGTTTTYTDQGLTPGTYTYEVKAVDAAGNVSDPSNAFSVTVEAPDTQKPTVPGNLSAASHGSVKVDLAWLASTDDKGVTRYDVYRDNAFLTSISPATAYTDASVVPGVTYVYEVHALDAAINDSGPSNSATVTVDPLDTQKPTAPQNLAALLNGTSQVDLSWQASTDNVGVTGYNVYRDGSLITTTTGATASYSDVARPAGTYHYEVRALDAAGNVSDPSNTASATVPDTERPTIPGNLTATVSGARVDLSWQASSDNVAVTKYRVFRGSHRIATIGPGTTTYTDAGLAPGGYRYAIQAGDAAGNISYPSNGAKVTIADTQKPTAPQNLAAAANGTSQIDLSWHASIDDVGVTGYRVFRGTTQVASLNGTTTTYSDTGLSPGTYQYSVNAVDAAGNVSDASNTASASLGSPPATLTIPPEADARVEAGAPTTNFGTSYLRADGATDPAVDSFLRFTVSGVQAGSVLSAKLRLYAYTPTVDGPAVYTTGSSWSETTISWNNRPPRTSAATDKKGAISTNSWVEYDVTSLVSGNGTYSFDIATNSTDGVDFYSRENATLAPELVVSTGTPDTTKPTTPANLGATANGPNRIDLSWLASTDNVAVTGYNVYRGGTLLAPIGSTTSYADSSVAPNTAYSYEVRAFDAAGNLSDPSNSASATTPAAPPAPIVKTIAPEADARVHQSNPTTNYGTSYLRADGGTDPGVETFLRFTVTGVTPGTVQTAKLRLYAYSPTVDGPSVSTTSPSWNEATVNWNTKPTPTSSATDKKATIPTNSWVEYDVTPFVTGNGTYSFRIATTSTDGVDFYSRESATLRPELVVTSH